MSFSLSDATNQAYYRQRDRRWLTGPALARAFWSDLFTACADYTRYTYARFWADFTFALAETHQPKGLTCSVMADTWANAVKLCSIAVNKKPSLPILGCAKLTVDETNQSIATLTTTNLETAITVTLPVGRVEVVGESCFSLAALDKTKGKPGANTRLDLADKPYRHTFHIQHPGAGTATHLPTIDPAEYPVVPRWDLRNDPVFVNTDSKTLKTALAFLLETDGECIHFQVSGASLTLTAWDSYRIHRAVITLDNALEDHTVLVPRGSCEKLNKTLDKGPVFLSQVNRRLFAVFTSVGLRTELGSDLPDYRVPDAVADHLGECYPFALTLVPGEVKAGIKRAKLFIEDKGFVSLTVTRDPYTFALVGESNERGSVSTGLTGQMSLRIPPRTLRFNPARLIDVIDQMSKADTLTLRYGAAGSPVSFDADHDSMRLSAVLAQVEEPEETIEGLEYFGQWHDRYPTEEGKQGKDHADAEAAYIAWIGDRSIPRRFPNLASFQHGINGGWYDLEQVYAYVYGFTDTAPSHHFNR